MRMVRIVFLTWAPRSALRIGDEAAFVNFLANSVNFFRVGHCIYVAFLGTLAS